jgi:hypothetical protein
MFTAADGLAERIVHWQGRSSFPEGCPLRISYGNGLFVALVAADEVGVLLQSESIPNAEISTFPSSLDFGTVSVGSSSSVNLTLTNSGSVSVLIRSLAISGPNAIDFNIGDENCTGPALDKSQSCAVQIVFSPHTSGFKTATLSISSDDPVTPLQRVSLSGNGSGLLPGTNESYCFISFSALGSGLEQYMGVLRAFRDIFLMENKVGRTLVAFYYQHSPSLVQFIAENDSWRELVQMGLVPLVAVSYLALYTSPTEKAFFFFLLSGIMIARWLMMRRSFR